MTMTPEELQDFIERWNNAFGERLREEDAILVAERLLAFYSLISRPMPRDVDTEEESATAETGGEFEGDRAHSPADSEPSAGSSPQGAHPATATSPPHRDANRFPGGAG